MKEVQELYDLRKTSLFFILRNMNNTNTMKTMIYKKCENDTCPICLEEYEDG